MTNPTPNPLNVFGSRTIEKQAAVMTDMQPTDLSKTVRPGLVLDTHDGVIKAKHLKPGQKVRAFLKGEPRGGERTVGSVTRIGDGAMVQIEWASGHPTADYKAAYRWHDATLVGTPISKPALVDYQEV